VKPPVGTRRPPRPTLVLLCRHALTGATGIVLPGRAPGLHLSDEGRRQAEALARRLGALRRIAAVYTSPLERARETARPVAQALGLPLRAERGLIECDFGDWTGRRLARLVRRPEWQAAQRHPSGFRFPGGESFTGMQARVAGTLARLVGGHPGRAVVAVSHADPIKAALAHALGMHLDLFQRLVIAPASVSVIVYRPEGPRVLTVNSLGGDLAALLPR